MTAGTTFTPIVVIWTTATRCDLSWSFEAAHVSRGLEIVPDDRICSVYYSIVLSPQEIRSLIVVQAL